MFPKPFQSFSNSFPSRVITVIWICQILCSFNAIIDSNRIRF